MHMSGQEGQGIRATGFHNLPQTAQPGEASTSIAACSDKLMDLLVSQEDKAEGPLSTHPSSPDPPITKHVSRVYATNSDKNYSVGGGLEGLGIQHAIKACLCSTRDETTVTLATSTGASWTKLPVRWVCPTFTQTTTRIPQAAKTPQTPYP